MQAVFQAAEKLRSPEERPWRKTTSCHRSAFGIEECAISCTSQIKSLKSEVILPPCFFQKMHQDRWSVRRCDKTDNSDNEGIEDEPVAFDEEDLLEATLTHVKGSGKRQEEEETQGNGSQLDQEDEDNARRGNAMRYDLTMEMLHISDKVWASAKEADGGDLAMQQIHQAMMEAKSVQDHIQAKKAAQASRNRKPASSASSKRGQLVVGEPSVKHREPVTVDKLRQWLESDHVRRGTNAKQHEFLELVVDRILVEAGLLSPEESVRQTNDPLVWLLHGPPGTGKSHVIGFVRELFELIGYDYGLDYEIVAFQAVNAADLQGKTIHGAFNFDITASAGKPASEDAAKCMANWRWLILDEISLTDAKLFGKCEQRLQAVMPNANEWKRDGAGRIRPFAGVNVILTGDFHQLPPPAGHYLAAVPRSLQDPSCEKKPEDAFADYGKQLLWGGATQGVTELEDRERCKDEWWNQVVDATTFTGIPCPDAPCGRKRRHQDSGSSHPWKTLACSRTSSRRRSR